jgi:LAO/AO transport system kinase
VIAVDPSSKSSGGALLGDRVRIVHDSADEGVFVRSMAARDRLGGLADQTLAAMVVMRALFDRVLIETVGVGQSETDVAGVADTVVFCVQPGSGDSLQFMKAGIVEIPHVIAVTKADLGGSAERARADVAGALSLATAGDGGDWPLQALAVSARSGAGLDGLLVALEAHRAHLAADGRLVLARHHQSEGWVAQSLRDRFGRDGIARLGRLGFDLALAPGVQPFQRLRELGAALEKTR